MYNIKLKNLRVEKNLRQKDIASILGISEITYTHYESEYYIIPINHLIKICDYFNIALDYIFNFTENSTKQTFNTTTKEEAGKRLKTWRKENKITQEKLATTLNTTQGVIANYERGRNIIATPFLYTICKKYNVSADYLIGRID